MGPMGPMDPMDRMGPIGNFVDLKTSPGCVILTKRSLYTANLPMPPT